MPGGTNSVLLSTFLLIAQKLTSIGPNDVDTVTVSDIAALCRNLKQTGFRNNDITSVIVLLL